VALFNGPFGSDDVLYLKRAVEISNGVWSSTDEQSPRIDDISLPDDLVAKAKFLTEDPEIRERIAVACHKETEGDMSRGQLATCLDQYLRVKVSGTRRSTGSLHRAGSRIVLPISVVPPGSA
jgi:hypothetical protein